MKNKIRLILMMAIIAMMVSSVAESQEVSNVSITGSFTVGSEVVAGYIIQGTATDTIFQWYEVTAADTSVIGTDNQKLTIPASTLNKRLLLKITLIEPAATVADSAYSPLTILITANQAPVASSLSITGSRNVNEYLLGNYTYFDAEGNQEGNSTFEWWISASATGMPSSIITGETSRTYKLRLSDQGKYLIFKVIPQAQTGTTPGAQSSSSAYGPVNSAPYATDVTISNLPVLGNTLAGSFTFNDPDGEVPGVHTYRWLRDGLPIAGAVSDTYTLVPDDVGSKIIFEVTPVSSAGFPLIGLPVQSPETATVTDPSGDEPSASDLCISGTRSTGSVLTGKYTFSDPKFNEQNSKFFWFRGSSRVPLATSITYSVVAADLESELFFAVIPRNNRGVEGDTAFSQTLALINLPAETFSTGDPDVVLSATPGGGVFSGDGVISGKFSPSYVGEGGPYTISYLLNIVLPTKSCTQTASKDVNVNSVDAFFESFRNVYCHNGGKDTIYVTNVPAGAIAKNFSITDPAGIVTQLTDTSLIIDPGMMRPGNKADTLFFSYELDGSFYPISKPFVIDSVNSAISFANLDAAYCEESARRFITIQGIFPSGGTGVWTGDIVAEPSASTAFIDPTMGTPGNSYPVTYRYTSPLGCATPSISRTVTINPLPDAGFPLNSTYNVDGPGEELVPVTPGGIFTGPGISGYTFYPSIAREGTHNITYSVTDSKGCRQDSTRTTEVKKAAGSITGLNPGNQYCYDGSPDSLRFESTEPWITGMFSGPGLQDLTGGRAIFTPSVAGRGDHRLVFAYIDFTFTYYEITQIVNVDSIGQVTVENLVAGSVYCTGDSPFTLYTNKEGGIFSGPVTGTSFDPSKGPGTSPVVYTYTNSRTGCASSVSVPVTIHPSPVVSFTVADVCIDNATDTTRFVNSTTSSDPVTLWQWEFSGGGGVTISNLETPGHLYNSDGLHQVRLTATTSNGCISFSEKTIDLGLKPEADFYWLNECFHEGDSVRIFDNTLKGSPVTSRSWNFFDGNPPLTVLNPRYPKLSAGYVPAEYIVNTNYLNCSDTVRKDIFIRPTIELTSDDYFEDFETGAGGWIADSEPDNIWALGTPDRPVINKAASGTTAWYTAYDIANQTVQSASLSSPCFDFSASERPMISMKLWRRFDRNRDGAALQYKIGDSPEWEYLGTIGDGIEWFNSTLIKGRPGGEQTGWTTLATPDTAWTEARRRLDEINGKQDVKFRIAYGSDGTSQDNDGIAVDDIRIGARTRNVLLEHFTNNSSTTVVRANGIVNTVSSELVRDVININYHTNFPGPDLLYNDIPSDMSARVLYYGLSRVPYSLVDGGTTKEFSGIFDYLVADLDSNELNKRSLISPQFRIEINPVLSAGLLVTNARLTALDDLNEENVTLYIAVTAKEIATVSSSNGETLFRNTLRKMLPDAGGSNLQKRWTRGESYVSPDFTWKITNIYDSDDIEIIAFVQNNVTREIYQATASGITDVTVGVERVYGDDAAFSLYPNPSSGRLVISFGEPLGSASEVQILDQTGSLLRRYSAGSGQTMLEIDDHTLPNGVYIVRMMSGNLSGGMRKLVVSGR